MSKACGCAVSTDDADVCTGTVENEESKKDWYCTPVNIQESQFFNLYGL